MIAFLEALHATKHPEKPRREKKQRAPKFKVYHSLEKKAFLVWLRYGTLKMGRDQEKRRLSMQHILAGKLRGSISALIQL